MANTLKEISEKILTQDNRCTSQPLFVVFQKKRIYGMDPEYDGPIVWIADDYEAEPDEHKKLEEDYEINYVERDGWQRTSYIDIDVFVTACFTEDGAKAYIEINGHNLKEPFIYVETLHRNAEMNTVRDALKNIQNEDLLSTGELIKERDLALKRADSNSEFYRRRCQRLNEWFRSDELKDTKMAYEWFSINANGHLMNDINHKS